MEFYIYIYAGKHQGTVLIPFRCPRCGRIVFRHNSRKLVITNSFGASLEEIKPGLRDGENMPVMTEHKCHSCKSLLKILFQ